jgi:putative ABC transport system permease protein
MLLLREPAGCTGLHVPFEVRAHCCCGAAWLVALGGAFGLAGASVAVRFVRGRLFGVEPTDSVTWIAVSAVLVLVAVIACVLPARRAMRIDPAAALRSR